MSNTGGQHWGFYWRLPSLLLLRLHMPKSVQAYMGVEPLLFSLTTGAEISHGEIVYTRPSRLTVL
jgi:hypothetical protein